MIWKQVQDRSLRKACLNDTYDIAKEDFKSMIDIHVENMTITEEEINQIESRTRGQGNNEYWHEKRRSILTACNFGKAAKNKGRTIK